MNTWGTLEIELSQLLDDADFATFPEALRIACFNRAMQYFAITHTAVFAMETGIASAFGDGAMLEYPSNFIQFGGIKVFSEWMQPSLIIPGNDETKNGYFALTDKIFFPRTEFFGYPASSIIGKSVEMWYYGHYPAVASNESKVGIPVWSEWGLLNLCIAYILYPQMLSMAELRRFETKRDAGTPEMNSPRKQAEYHMQVYFSSLEQMPAQVRTLMYKPRS
jgi:hypothetical protein